MQKTLTLNKPLGKTPLEVVEQFRSDHNEYTQAKMAYAGRLDPMAQGKLLVLVGDECKKRDKYLGLDKEYEFEVLLGMSSDTHDILGLTTSGSCADQTKNIKKVLDSLRGEIELPYPAYSSKTVKGKPLFLWALEEKISEIEIPTKQVQIYNLEQISELVMTKEEVLKVVKEKIAKVTQVTDDSKQLGRDFRRKEVLDTWQANLGAGCLSDEFTILTFRCTCSSGTYMRVLASIIGQQLGSGGLAWSIKRTKIGMYKQLLGSFGVWLKKY